MIKQFLVTLMNATAFKQYPVNCNDRISAVAIATEICPGMRVIDVMEVA